MSSITAADLKLGGRLIAACDAMGQGHLNRAAGIFMEISGDLSQEALTAPGGLLAPDEDADPDAWMAAPMPKPATPQPAPAPAQAYSDPAALQMCARNVHAWGSPAPVTGWRTCGVCGSVNVAPPGDGPVDLGASR
jgi:hypothetical protein